MDNRFWRVWEGKECFERNILLSFLQIVFALCFSVFGFDVLLVDFLVVVILLVK